MSVRSVSSTYWYVPLQYGYHLPVFLSVDASFFKSLFVWWTSKGRSTISPPGLRTATVLLLLDTSIPTAVITAASISLTSFNAGSAYAHYRFSLLCDTNVRQHLLNLRRSNAAMEMAENSLRVRAFSSSNASFSQHIFIVA